LTVFRAGDVFKNRTRAYGWTAASAGTLVIVLALLGARLIGVAGVPIGATLGCLLPSAVLLAIGIRKHHPLPIDYPRLLGALGLAAACWAPAALVSGDGGTIAALAKLGGLLCFPLGLLVLGIIPRGVLGELRSAIRALVPHRRDRGALVLRVAELPASQRDALLTAVRDRVTPGAAALRLGIDEDTLLCRLVAGLRRLAGGSGGYPLDEQLGRYLTSTDPPADRDAALRELRWSGANMVESRVMEGIYHRLRGMPRRVWNRSSPAGADRAVF